MQETGKKERREEVYSKVVRAGKRTYFFDVKATQSNQHYLTITESKRRFSESHGKFFYEKHKIFLYNEDFDKFLNGLNDAISFIHNSDTEEDNRTTDNSEHKDTNSTLEVNFEDLGNIVSE